MIQLPSLSTLFPYTTLFRSRDGFGDRVLDLQSRVHFHEEEFAAFQQELHRARADVAGRLRELHGAAAHALAQRGVHGRTDRKSTRLNSSHPSNSYAAFCLKT